MDSNFNYNRNIYGYLPINLMPDSLSIISLGAGAGLDVPVFPFMNVKLFGVGGYYLGIIDENNSGLYDFTIAGP